MTKLGERYWCDVCGQHHTMYSKIGERHRRYANADSVLNREGSIADDVVKRIIKNR